MKPVKKDTNRIAKVNSLIRRELGPVLLRFLQDFKGLVTITKVDTSRDMKWAKVWITIMGNTDLQKKTMDVLKENIHDLQESLVEKLEMKIVPRVKFVIDHGEEYAARIDELLKIALEDE